MKSTIPNFSRFWANVLPVMFMFFCIGMNQAQAQNYKPLDQAVASVQAALENLQQELDSKQYQLSAVPVPATGSPSTSKPALTSDAKLKIFEVTYFDEFLTQAKLTGSVVEAMQGLDNLTNTQGHPQSRVTLVAGARAALMALITQ